MKVLILNSGLGSRMGDYTSDQPKCMTELLKNETILERQFRLLVDVGVDEVVITTGYYNEILVKYSLSLALPIHYKFVHNVLYDKTNYIYSIYCTRDIMRDNDVILLHGDLVFEYEVLKKIIDHPSSCMKVSSTLPLPEKDFKVVISEGRVKKVGVEFFDNVMEAQAMYKLKSHEWNLWLNKICEFCENDRCNCYAEAALNEITDECIIEICDVGDKLCTEVDTPEDLQKVLDILVTKFR